MTKKYALIPIILTVIMGSLLLVAGQFHLPDPLPVDAPAEKFSAQRAIDRLEPLVEEPHPAGSTALAEVRGDLVSQLEEMGLEVEIQSTTGTLPRYQVAGRVDNILARLPGTDSSGALLLMAHYDSVPQGPGAGDNGAGVVTILESLRALSGQRPFKNDLIVFFTDAEEYGTLGAQAFVNQHPWMEDISVALNIEGTLKGSVVLVETGPENGWLVRNFRQASPHPLGYSWLFDLFGMMPNLTDFIPFREAGLAGANLFSFNGGPFYHTPEDTIANMDARSLQQHGEQTLALIEHFSRVDLGQTHAANVIYFNLFSNLMVIYPSSWALPLAILTTLVLIGVLGWSVFKKRSSPVSILACTPGALAGLAAGPVLATLLWGLISQLFPQTALYFPAHTYNDGWYALAFTALAAGATLIIFRIYLRKHSWGDLLASGLVLLAVVNLPISIYLPGFSYLFTWPILLAVVPWGIFLSGKSRNHWLEIISWTTLVVPSLLLWLPVGLILYWSSGIDFLPAIALTATLPLTLISPRFDFLANKKGWLAPLLCGAVFLICFFGGSLAGSFNSNHPMPVRVQYFYNFTSGEAFWVNSNAPLSDWQEQFTEGGVEKASWKEIFPSFQSVILKSPAPVFDLEPSVVSVLENGERDGLRVLRLHISPSRKSDQIILSLPPGTALESLEADGRTWTEGEVSIDGWQTFYYIAPPSCGVEIVIQSGSPGPSLIMVTERSVGLDAIPGDPIRSRPPEIMDLGDYLFVNQTINLD